MFCCSIFSGLLINFLCARRFSTTIPNKQKNIARSDKGDKIGRIHMKKQNLDKLAGKRTSALRIGSHSKKSAEGGKSAGMKRSRSEGDVKPAKKSKKSA